MYVSPCEQISAHHKNTPETNSVHVNKQSSPCSVQCVYTCVSASIARQCPLNVCFVADTYAGMLIFA